MAVSATTCGGTVEIAITGLYQRRIGIEPISGKPPEGVQNRLHTRGGNTEHCAGAIFSAAGRGTVEIAIATLHQGGARFATIGAGGTERIQCRLNARRRDPECRALAVGAAAGGGAIKIAVIAQNERRGWPHSNCVATAGSGERIQHRLRARRCDLEHCAAAVGPAIGGGSVETSVAALHQRGAWNVAIRRTAAK